MARCIWRAGRPPICALLLVAAAGPAAATTWTLDAATWARPRSGTAVLSMPPLPTVVDAWASRPGGAIVIHHPGGENGEIWAAELRDWLVALGVPGSRIELIGGGAPDQLELAVR